MADRQLCGRDNRRISRAIPVYRRRCGERGKEARCDERDRPIRTRELATVDLPSAAALKMRLNIRGHKDNESRRFFITDSAEHGHALRLLVRHKVHDGRLPHNRIARISSRVTIILPLEDYQQF
jgi:hypothetical protein